MAEKKLGVAGTLAKNFTNSVLTPLALAALVLSGVYTYMNLEVSLWPEIQEAHYSLYIDDDSQTAEINTHELVSKMSQSLWRLRHVEFVFALKRDGGFVIRIFRKALTSDKSLEFERQLHSILPSHLGYEIDKEVFASSGNYIPVFIKLHAADKNEGALETYALALKGSLASVPSIDVTDLQFCYQRENGPVIAICDPTLATEVEAAIEANEVHSLTKKVGILSLLVSSESNLTGLPEQLGKLLDALPFDVSVYGLKPQDILEHRAVFEMQILIATAVLFCLLLLTMNYRAAIIVSISTLVALFCIFIYLFINNEKLDYTTTFIIILSLGMVVDDMVVVTENIYRRWYETGRTSVVVTVDAVREVGFPTISATVMARIGFLPLLYIATVLGFLAVPIAIIGTVAVLSSLLISFTLTPYLAQRYPPSMSWFFAAEAKEKKLRDVIDSLMTPVLKSVQGVKIPFPVIVVVFLLSVIMAGYTAIDVSLRSALLPEIDRAYLRVGAEMEDVAQSDKRQLIVSLIREYLSSNSSSAEIVYAGNRPPQFGRRTIESNEELFFVDVVFHKQVNIEKEVRNLHMLLHQSYEQERPDMISVERIPLGPSALRTIRLFLITPHKGTLVSAAERLQLAAGANAVELKPSLSVEGVAILFGLSKQSVVILEGIPSLNNSVLGAADILNDQIDDSGYVNWTHKGVQSGFLSTVVSDARGVGALVGGWALSLDELSEDLWLYFFILFFALYCLLVVHLGSFRIPVYLLLPIPLQIIASVGSHWLLGIPFGYLSLIGTLFMAGIVLRGGVILVATFVELRTLGMAHGDALLQACLIRVRPIAITVVTLVATASIIGSHSFWEGLSISIVTSMVVYSIAVFMAVSLSKETLEFFDNMPDEEPELGDAFSSGISTDPIETVKNIFVYQ